MIRTTINRISRFFRSRTRIGAAVVFIVLIIGIAAARNSRNEHQNTVRVTRGSIAQEVVATGKTVAAEAFSLSFEKTGTIARVNGIIGDHVEQGAILAELDLRELDAQLREAEANIAVQSSKLDELKRGPRPEDVRVKTSEFQKAEQDLANLYASVFDVIDEAYTKADDAVRTQTDEFFTNDEEPNPQLTFVVTDSQKENDLEFLRKVASAELAAWKAELDGLRAVSGTKKSYAQFDEALAHAQQHLLKIRDFLGLAIDVLSSATTLSQSDRASYLASASLGRTNATAALSSVSGQIQSIASQALVVERIANELDRTLAGATTEEISTQEALVAQARANADIIRAQRSRSIIRSPISGLISKFDAKVGEVAAVNAPLVTVISGADYEVEVNIPEIDVGKVSLGNPVRITFDAYPGETFSGTIARLDPAETIVDGIINYEAAISFDAFDPRFKSGLTANLVITTLARENALILPQYAIRDAADGLFVKKITGTEARDVPVTIGIRSISGNIEVTGGLAEGDQVAVSVGTAQ